MKICPKCNTEYSANDVFCNRCGERLVTYNEDQVPHGIPPFQDDYSYDDPYAAGNTAQPADNSSGKKTLMIICISALSVLIIAVAFLIIWMFMRSDKNDPDYDTIAMNDPQITTSVFDGENDGDVTKFNFIENTNTVPSDEEPSVHTTVSSSDDKKKTEAKTTVTEKTTTKKTTAKTTSTTKKTTAKTTKTTTTTVKATTTEAAAINPDDLIRVTDKNLFIADRSLLGLSRAELSAVLGADVPEPVDFPWWGTDLKNTDMTYNDIDLCFMFQYDRLVAVIYDTMESYDENVALAACQEFGVSVGDAVTESGLRIDLDDYNCYEMYEDVYAETGETCYHQMYVIKGVME